MTHYRLTWVDCTEGIPDSRGIHDSDDMIEIARVAQVVIDKLVKDGGYTPKDYSLIILNNEELWAFIESEYWFMAVVIFCDVSTGITKHLLYLNKTPIISP